MSARALVEVEDLEVVLGTGTHRTHALRGVSLTVQEGTSVGLVGESGSGKSTLAKALCGEVPVAGGTIWVGGGEPVAGPHRHTRPQPTMLQMIPQDPYSSLDPRHTAGQAIAEALDPRRPRVRRHRDTIVEWLERVGLPAGSIEKYPHEFSGGQRQRIAIARALCVRPRVIVADEITSALDVSVQAEILELLAELRVDLGLTMLFISHNLAVVKHVCDRVAVIYHGSLVETGDVEDVFTRPREQYTQRLLDSVPGAPGFTLEGD
ncbi:ABC transporter ATP-binding protein [Phycicoccus endophyticus]|uniref:ABC transporter ATP-binding protein n=1 Tax=Phycicoccus endophyticus TaxID=1690220 RepID=A0A7G9QZR0_9MICO|nr:ABC transporter ATP-binding protein [Phycicoccus endophyticus]NHI20030.1 ABC transporter ATP-binding protein [Phycicoccus endophyticus]QNN48835.1 ABC transporter ATP-binding protein [Phycicoccus endophyticus]GGL42441.1 hypothetical protein GCM10012283_26340 [Phycicoccus endophyticus]